MRGVTDMLVFNEPTAKPNVAAPAPSDKEPCRCFACSHRRASAATPRQAALVSWRRLAETLRPSAGR
ncbi:hypothetical protein [Aureimonas glaciei]|uniref:Uncharacterized protein n=1 Tax=Aureimonas glaciei TaxID=1776957 RepID=A0A917D856_9HYPH|nr:hypothetical protein [Aureimonas glaciei]GGD14001.1 hypothetical protein GCM10011335_15950 [Aureimonas glaciei]